MGWGRTQVYQHGPRCECRICQDINRHVWHMGPLLSRRAIQTTVTLVLLMLILAGFGDWLWHLLRRVTK
jgi:hypothetical protein